LSQQLWDAVVVSGDISQDHSIAAYEILRDLCQRYLGTTAVAWLPGNHDELAALQSCYGQAPFVVEKHLQLGDWQLLLLNSKGPTPAGLMSQTHLAQLHKLLQQLPSASPVAVFCHHHLLPLGCYIDIHKMANGEALLALLSGFEQVRCISHGHVHQQRETLIKRPQNSDIQLWATPSTAVQFNSDKARLGIDDKGPAFRYFELTMDGKVHSDVVWC
jgi:Icc protein